MLNKRDLASVINKNYSSNFVVGPTNLYAEEINSMWRAVINSRNVTTLPETSKSSKR